MGRESGVFTTMLKLQFVSFLEAGCRLVPDRRLSEKPDVERQRVRTHVHQCRTRVRRVSIQSIDENYLVGIDMNGRIPPVS